MELLEMAAENANDGDNNEYRYVPGRSMTSFILSANDRFSFYFLHPHATHWEGRTFFPYNCTKILGSSMGIVLSYPYAVNNPLIKGSVVGIPTPITTHTDPVDPHALVAYADDNLGHLVFYVVCAFLVGHHQYKFNVYSSYSNEWRYGQIPESLGDIMVDAGISCGRRAYWLTKRPLHEVVYYDVSDGTHGFLNVPKKFQVDPCPCLLQLGSWGRNQLILLMSMATEMEVYTLTHGEQQWELSFHQEFRNRRPPVPIRSQSHMLQAVFWVDDQMLIWERRSCNENRMGQPQPPRMRLQPFPEMQPDVIVDFVPHIENTLRPQDFDPGYGLGMIDFDPVHGFRHD